MHIGERRQIVNEMVGIKLLFGQLKRCDRRLLKRLMLDVLVDQLRFRQLRQLIEEQLLVLHTDAVVVVQTDHDHLEVLSVQLIVLVQFLVEVDVVLHRRLGSLIVVHLDLAALDAVLVRLDELWFMIRFVELIGTIDETIRFVADRTNQLCGRGKRDKLVLLFQCQSFDNSIAFVAFDFALTVKLERLRALLHVAVGVSGGVQFAMRWTVLHCNVGEDSFGERATFSLSYALDFDSVKLSSGFFF